MKNKNPTKNTATINARTCLITDKKNDFISRVIITVFLFLLQNNKVNNKLLES